MKKFFKTVIGFFDTVWEFLSTIVDGFITFLQVLSEVLVLPPVLASVMPTILSTAIISIVSIAVAKIIIGR